MQTAAERKAIKSNPVLNTWYKTERHLRRDKIGREVFKALLANVIRRQTCQI